MPKNQYKLIKICLWSKKKRVFYFWYDKKTDTPDGTCKTDKKGRIIFNFTKKVLNES